MNKLLTKSKPLRKPAPRKRVAKKVAFGSGVVAGQIHGGGAQGAVELSPGKLIDAIRGGLPASELETLRINLGVSMDTLASRLGISKATLHRRKAEGRLAPGESDRVLRLARLLGKAIEVMESEQAARLWLTSPQVGLGGEVPLDYAKTEVGAREVEDLLGRIEYGVYS